MFIKDLGFRDVRRFLGCRVKRARELGFRGVKKLGLGVYGIRKWVAV